MKNEKYIEELKALKNSTALWNNPKAVEAIEAGIEALEEKDAEETSWISVSERLPEDVGGDYLVNIEYKGEHEGVDIATYIIGGYLDGLWDTPNDWIEGSSEYWHVTAWQPLPKPYKVENKTKQSLAYADQDTLMPAT